MPVEKTELDPNEGLAADAALAADLGDEDERRRDQVAHLGGEIDEEIDDEDFSDADRGDLIEDPEAVAERQKAAGAKPDGDKDDDDSEDDSEGDSEDGDGEGGDADADEEDSDGDEDADDDEEDSDGDEDADADEEEEDDEGEDEDSSAAKQKPTGIPKHRFDEVNERMKAAETQVAALRAEIEAGKQAEEEKFDFEQAEQEYIEFVQDGKTEEAKAKRREIRAAEKAEWEADAVEKSTAKSDASSLEKEINALSIQAEARYPLFDKDHEDYDHRATARVMTYFRGYLNSGELEASDAFVAALADVIELYDLEDKYPSGDAPADKEVDEEDTKKSKKKVTKKAKKKKVDKALDEAKKSPPDLSDTGEGSRKRGSAAPDIETMTDDEFDALPESEQAKLRGDFM